MSFKSSMAGPRLFLRKLHNTRNFQEYTPWPTASASLDQVLLFDAPRPHMPNIISRYSTPVARIQVYALVIDAVRSVPDRVPPLASLDPISPMHDLVLFRFSRLPPPISTRGPP